MLKLEWVMQWNCSSLQGSADSDWWLRWAEGVTRCSLLHHVWAAHEFSILLAAARAKKPLEWFCIHSPKCRCVLGQMLKAEISDSGQQDPMRSSQRQLKRRGRCPQNEWDCLSYLATKTFMSSVANNKYARKYKLVLHCPGNLAFEKNKVMCEEQLSWAWIWADKSDTSNRKRHSENSRPWFSLLCYRMYIHSQSVLYTCNCRFLSDVDLLKNTCKWHFMSFSVSKGTVLVKLWLTIVIQPSLCSGQAVTMLQLVQKKTMTCLFRLYGNWLTRHRISNGAHVLGPQLQIVAGRTQGESDSRLHTVVAPLQSGAFRTKAETCLCEGWS